MAQDACTVKCHVNGCRFHDYFVVNNFENWKLVTSSEVVSRSSATSVLTTMYSSLKSADTVVVVHEYEEDVFSQRGKFADHSQDKNSIFD